MSSVLSLPRPPSGRLLADVPMNGSEHNDARSPKTLVWTWIRAFLGSIGIILIFVNLCLVLVALIDALYKPMDWATDACIAGFCAVNASAGLLLAVWGLRPRRDPG